MSIPEKKVNKFGNNFTNLKSKCLKQCSLLESISLKMKNNILIVTKADKGNCTIIMNKIEYIDKTEEFLVTNNYKI